MGKTLNSRRYTGGGPRPDLTKTKREEAKERKAFWDLLGPKKQIQALNDRLGVNVGAKRQRARIEKFMQRSVPQ